MTGEEIAEAQRPKAMVVAVMNGAASAEPDRLGGSAVDGTLMLQALQFITVAMFEAHPGLATPRYIRAATKKQAKQMQACIRRFREDFERTGERSWGLINAPAEKMQ